MTTGKKRNFKSLNSSPVLSLSAQPFQPLSLSTFLLASLFPNRLDSVLYWLVSFVVLHQHFVHWLEQVRAALRALHLQRRSLVHLYRRSHPKISIKRRLVCDVVAQVDKPVQPVLVSCGRWCRTDVCHRVTSYWSKGTCHPMKSSNQWSNLITAKNFVSKVNYNN